MLWRNTCFIDALLLTSFVQFNWFVNNALSPQQSPTLKYKTLNQRISRYSATINKKPSKLKQGVIHHDVEMKWLSDCQLPCRRADVPCRSEAAKLGCTAQRSAAMSTKLGLEKAMRPCYEFTDDLHKTLHPLLMASATTMHTAGKRHYHTL